MTSSQFSRSFSRHLSGHISSKLNSRLSAAFASLLLLSSTSAFAESSVQSLEAAVGKEQCRQSVASLPSTVSTASASPMPGSAPSPLPEQPLKIAHVAPVAINTNLTGSDVIRPVTSASGLEIAPDSEPILIAQAASCATCGTAIDPLILMESGSKRKDKSLLTDSLWGNLILEMAYQRDTQLRKLAKRMNLVNYGTMASIGTIAGGTLAQGIIALQTLNPPDGHLDSYTPGIIGTTLSTATIMTFVARMYFSHKMQKDVENRQMAIKTKVEGVLDHLERSESKCADAQKDLTGLIGDRACHEWLQLWQSSHKLAMAQPPRITLSAPKVAPPKSAISYDVDTVVSGEFWER